MRVLRRLGCRGRGTGGRGVDGGLGGWGMSRRLSGDDGCWMIALGGSVARAALARRVLWKIPRFLVGNNKRSHALPHPSTGPNQPLNPTSTYLHHPPPDVVPHFLHNLHLLPDHHRPASRRTPTRAPPTRTPPPTPCPPATTRTSPTPQRPHTPSTRLHIHALHSLISIFIPIPHLTPTPTPTRATTSPLQASPYATSAQKRQTQQNNGDEDSDDDGGDIGADAGAVAVG